MLTYSAEEIQLIIHRKASQYCVLAISAMWIGNRNSGKRHRLVPWRLDDGGGLLVQRRGKKSSSGIHESDKLWIAVR